MRAYILARTWAMGSVRQDAHIVLGPCQATPNCNVRILTDTTADDDFSGRLAGRGFHRSADGRREHQRRAIPSLGRATSGTGFENGRHRGNG